MKIRINGVKNSVFLAIILSIMLILPINSVNADIVKHLYEVEMPVEGQGLEERAYVVREALKEILVRVSGRKAASSIAMDRTLVPRATRFIQQFRYRKFMPNEAIPEVQDGAKPYTQKLWLRFTKKAVSKLLREHGLPVWGKTRPVTLVWLVVDDQNQRSLVGNSTEHRSRLYIEEEAKRRGLPFRLPLLDLADQLKLQVTDVWGNFEDTILDASLRYQTEAILVGRIYLSFSNTWHARWTLYSEGKREDWETSNSETLREAIKNGLSVTGETLSLRFTQIQNFDLRNLVMLQIKNIKNLRAYNKVIKYLKGLSIVSEIQIVQVNKDNIFLNIKSSSGRLGLAQAIALGHLLVKGIPKPLVRDEIAKVKQQSLQAELVYELVQ